jgi:hypothetical protein
VGAYGQAQTLRRQGKLTEARKQALVCARAPCPAALLPECVKWVGEIEEATPSVIFEAREAGEGGRVRTDVRVTMDGVLLADKLDGRAIDVDPGEHTFRFAADGAKTLEQKLIVVEGEKRRKIAVELPPAIEKPAAPQPQPSPPLAEPEGPSWPPYVLAGVAILGAGGFAVAGLSGRSSESDLEACKPRCPSREVDSVRTKYVVADVSLGVGVVAGVVATILFFSKRSSPAPPVVERKAAP